MDPGLWFIVVVGGLSVLGGSLGGFNGVVCGFVSGLVLWLAAGLLYIIDIGYDCAEEADQHGGRLVSEKCV